MQDKKYIIHCPPVDATNAPMHNSHLRLNIGKCQETTVLQESSLVYSIGFKRLAKTQMEAAVPLYCTAGGAIKHPQGYGVYTKFHGINPC